MERRKGFTKKMKHIFDSRGSMLRCPYEHMYLCLKKFIKDWQPYDYESQPEMITAIEKLLDKCGKCP